MSDSADTATQTPQSNLDSLALQMDGIIEFASYWSAHGQQMVIALIVLVVGIVVVQHLGRWLGKNLGTWKYSSFMANELVISFYAIAGILLIWMLLRHLGFERAFVRQILMATALIVVAVVLLIRPYIPKLPFKVGNLIRTGEFAGKVVDISLLNTRLRTFDGLMIVVPNTTILNSYLVNYHTTPNRRVKIDVAIPYEQNIQLAKRLIEEQMVGDPRVLPSPRPVVYIIQIDDGCVRLGGRCWVKNPKAWIVRCEILEKTLYEFERAGIPFAIPRQRVLIQRDDAMVDASWDKATEDVT